MMKLVDMFTSWIWSMDGWPTHHYRGGVFFTWFFPSRRSFAVPCLGCTVQEARFSNSLGFFETAGLCQCGSIPSLKPANAAIFVVQGLAIYRLWDDSSWDYRGGWQEPVLAKREAMVQRYRIERIEYMEIRYPHVPDLFLVLAPALHLPSIRKGKKRKKKEKRKKKKRKKENKKDNIPFPSRLQMSYPTIHSPASPTT